MREPGGLEALGAPGRAAWSARVSTCIAQASAAVSGGARSLRATLDRESTQVTAPDWTGLPMRVSACLGRDRALRLLDWHRDELGDGGRALQDEYIEWRTLRSDEGRITRVELTTELPDYWCVLAAHEPETLLETVAKLADEISVPPSAVYADCDPFAAGVKPEEREEAFARTMLPPGRNPYNNGERAICCMAQPSNSLAGLALLTAAATTGRVVRDAVDGRLRCLTCSEAIPLLNDLTEIVVAQRGRGSDPILVERLGRLAYEGRLVSFDDPPGVYMQGVEHTRLRTPRGEAVPPEWFSFGRGLGPDAVEDGRPRYQRLTFRVPEEAGFAVSDVVDVATEQPLGSGAEIADLVQLAVFFRVSAPGTIPGEPEEIEIELEPVGSDPHGCEVIREHERRFLDDRRQP
jgi:hypothetical protein